MVHRCSVLMVMVCVPLQRGVSSDAVTPLRAHGVCKPSFHTFAERGVAWQI